MLAILLWLGCDSMNEREGCDGYPFVANDVVPDTVRLEVDGSTFRFNFRAAQVFEHTEGGLLNYRVAVPDRGLSLFSAVIGSADGILTIRPIAAGSEHIQVVVEDGCRKYESVDLFVVVSS